uniref:Ovule protein n=1 Tax=Elaeophora elaphi TaxID=1147741 RepID=A0A0R3RMC2_9BILA
YHHHHRQHHHVASVSKYLIGNTPINNTSDSTLTQTVLSPKKNMKSESKSDENITEEERKGKIQKAVMTERFYFICTLYEIKLKI